MFIPVYDENALKRISFQFVTVGLIVLNVVLFAVNKASMDYAALASFAVIPADLISVKYIGGVALSPFERFETPEWVTLITYTFFHADVFHLVGNMLFLWVFGDNVEDALGHFRFLVFYILCGIAGGLTHTVMTPDSTVPVIGASAAVAGIVAAYLMLHPRVGVWILVMKVLPLKISAGVVLGFWIGMQIVMLLVPQIGPVAWWSHIGGMIAGAILVVIMRPPGVALFDRDLRRGTIR